MYRMYVYALFAVKRSLSVFLLFRWLLKLSSRNHLIELGFDFLEFFFKDWLYVVHVFALPSPNRSLNSLYMWNCGFSFGLHYTLPFNRFVLLLYAPFGNSEIS